MRNNFKTKIRMLTSAAALGVAMMVGASMPANALILNFVDFIDNSTNGVGEQAITSTTDFGGLSNGAGTMLLGGVTVTAFGSNNLAIGTVANQGTGPYAYLDGATTNGGAGIGVCSSGLVGSNQCSTNSDDNVTGSPAEILSLVFDQDIRITRAFFRDASHRTVFPVGAGFMGPAKINVSSGTSVAFGAETLASSPVFGLLINNILGGGVLSAGTSLNFGYNNTEFYLSALDVFSGGPNSSLPPVPLPASIYLFGTGLLGIGFLARRRRRKTKGELKFA